MDLHLPSQEVGVTSSSDFVGIPLKDNDVTESINTNDQPEDGVDFIPVKESAAMSTNQTEKSMNLSGSHDIQPNDASSGIEKSNNKNVAPNRSVKFDMKPQTTAGQNKTSLGPAGNMKGSKSSTVVRHNLRDPLVRLEADTTQKLFSNDPMIVHGEKVRSDCWLKNE